jgi:hypothetical protein
MEDVGLFIGHLVYFTAVWYMYVYVVIRFVFPCFGMLYQEKSGNPGALWYLHRQKVKNVTMLPGRIGKLLFFSAEFSSSSESLRRIFQNPSWG